MTIRAIAALLACALVIGCSAQPASDPIVLASVYNVTGAQAVLDVPSSNGSSLAVAEINEQGGVLRRQLELVSVEGDSVPATLVDATERLFTDHPDVVALLGLSDTDMVLAAAPVAAARERVFLTSGATSPKLPGQVPDYLYLACFGDNVQAAAGAEWAVGELGVRTAMVMYDPGNTYTDLLQGYFVDRFSALGGEVTDTVALDPRAADLQLPQPGEVDLVFLGVQTAEDAARVVPLLRAGGYGGPILGGDGYDAESVWANAPDLADIYFTTHVYLGADNPNPKVGPFVEAYTSAYPDEPPSSFAALGYDAVGLMAAAIESAGTATPDAVAESLSGFQDHAGVTGTISFSSDSRIPSKSVTIVLVADGEQQFVTELPPESVPNP